MTCYTKISSKKKQKQLGVINQKKITFQSATPKFNKLHNYIYCYFHEVRKVEIILLFIPSYGNAKV